jgi:hypothetical protein
MTTSLRVTLQVHLDEDIPATSSEELQAIVNAVIDGKVHESIYFVELVEYSTEEDLQPPFELDHLSELTEHTPGPWVVCINSIDNKISVEQDGSSLLEGDPTIVVDCVDDMGQGLDRKTGLANARLIAAAPTLLAVCQEVLSYLPDKTIEGSWDSVSASLLQYAIDKAKGI